MMRLLHTNSGDLGRGEMPQSSGRDFMRELKDKINFDQQKFTANLCW